MVHDVISIGRIGVDIYPLQTGVGLESVTSFGKFLGGSATNVAVAASRYGLDSAIITKVGNDPFGRFLKAELGRLNVDSQFVGVSDDFKTPVVFCEMFPPDDFPIYFYREPKAPDLEIYASELDIDSIRQTSIFWSTVTGLSQEPSRTAHYAAFQARDRKKHTIIDLDYREVFWDSKDHASAEIAKVLPMVTVAVGNRNECEVAVGETDPYRAADALLGRGIELAIVKLGPKGVLGKTATEEIVVPPHVVDVVNGLGAGDAFGGALCFGLNQGWGLERILRFANIAGALVASRLECSTAMPFTKEIEMVMEDKGWS